MIIQIEWDDPSHSGPTNLLVPRTTFAYDRESFFFVVGETSSAFRPIFSLSEIFTSNRRIRQGTHRRNKNNLFHSIEFGVFHLTALFDCRAQRRVRNRLLVERKGECDWRRNRIFHFCRRMWMTRVRRSTSHLIILVIGQEIAPPTHSPSESAGHVYLYSQFTHYHNSQNCRPYTNVITQVCKLNGDCGGMGSGEPRWEV